MDKKNPADDAASRPIERSGQTPRWFQLRSDESIVLVARPSHLSTFYKYLYTFGLYGFWRKRNTSVVTRRRILMGRGIVNREEKSVPMSRVEDVKFLRRGLHSFAQLVVNDRGRYRTEEVGPLQAHAARRFAAAIRDQL
jgi:hypothetical protein